MTYMSVDHTKCEGFGFCEQADPSVFRLDQDGTLHITQPHTAQQEQSARYALRACPVSALRASQSPPSDNA